LNIRHYVFHSSSGAFGKRNQYAVIKPICGDVSFICFPVCGLRHLKLVLRSGLLIFAAAFSAEWLTSGAI